MQTPSSTSDTSQNIFYPRRFSTWVGILMVVVNLAFLPLFFSIPQKTPSDHIFFLLLVTFSIGCIIGFSIYTVWAYQSTVTTNAQALVERTPWKEKRIDWPQVQQVSTKEVYYKGRTWLTTTVSGNNATVVFSSRMPRYDELMEQIRSHAPNAANS